MFAAVPARSNRQIKSGTTAIRMNNSSQFLRSSPRLFVGIFVITAFVMMGFLLVMQHSHHNGIVFHEFSIVVDHLKG
jgi:hypothetical protein